VPSATARSASAYCSRVDSECSTTCCWLDCRVLRLRDHTLTLAELLTEHTPAAVRRPVLTQVHWHQHAVLGWGADEKLLAAAGAQAEHLETGCCGVAGNFGFQDSHGEVSEACAERALLPRLREAAPGTVVPAGGFSCRTQIHGLDSGGRGAMHLAELLATAGGLDHDHPEPTATPRPPRTASAAALAGTAAALAGAAAIAGGVAVAARSALIRAGAAGGKQRRFIRKALPTVLVVGPVWQ
jgi:hypothetical protein